VVIFLFLGNMTLSGFMVKSPHAKDADILGQQTWQRDPGRPVFVSIRIFRGKKILFLASSPFLAKKFDSSAPVCVHLRGFARRAKIRKNTNRTIVNHFYT
jgi:hypothetical protein